MRSISITDPVRILILLIHHACILFRNVFRNICISYHLSCVLRSKYERAMKDLDHTKKLLSQQHEDDLEQLMALKKQLEKKVGSSACYVFRGGIHASKRFPGIFPMNGFYSRIKIGILTFPGESNFGHLNSTLIRLWLDS